ncbi:MAG: restriction endonuclease, partial [Myxococcales bacterium]
TLAPTLAAAIRGDNAKRQATGRRPRFREGDGQISLLEWELPGDAVNAERDAVRAADRQRQSIRRALLKRLKDLPDGALLELLAAWLNAVGVNSLRAVRADAGDFNLAGTLRRGPEETPLAISIYKGRKPVDKEAIIALRGALHNFDHARIGWVITLGQAADGTAAEAHAEGAAPCAVFDGDALAASMEEVGVAIQRVTLPLAVLDIELLESLGGGSARASTSKSADETADSNGNKRRRTRRRGRRRGSREEGGEESTEEDSVEASEEPSDSDIPASEPPEPEAATESEAEPSEETEKKADDLAAEPPAEAEQL